MSSNCSSSVRRFRRFGAPWRDPALCVDDILESVEQRQSVDGVEDAAHVEAEDVDLLARLQLF